MIRHVIHPPQDRSYHYENRGPKAIASFASTPGNAASPLPNREPRDGLPICIMTFFRLQEKLCAMGMASWRNWLVGWYDRPGGARELLKIAWPLILVNSFWTFEVALDRMLLSRVGSLEVAASVPAAGLFWTPFILLQNTAAYATTFVAQYLGANRRRRVGPAVWQALHFSCFAGLLFLLLVPCADRLVAFGGHPPALRQLEVRYFQSLCFSALPTLITAASTSFFAGLGKSRTVLAINGFGLFVNAVAGYALIFGRIGCPALGIEGAGWATVIGSTAAAIVSLVVLFQREFDAEYCTRRGWRLEPALLGRLLYYGVPNGMHWFLESLALTVFLFLIGRLGEVDLAASNIAFTVNNVAFFPAVGLGQAVAILVGQRLGQNRPELAERTAWVGFGLAWTYMSMMAGLYVLAPGLFIVLFAVQGPAEQATAIALLTATLLRFVAFYSLFDSLNAVFSFALRGAGDTHFVTAAAFGLSWPVMVIPTWLAWRFGWGLYWAWGFVSIYVVLLGLIFLARFRGGKWKSMRVIEPEPPADAAAAIEAA
jgi:MATE family multidrug resistance protein